MEAVYGRAVCGVPVRRWRSRLRLCPCGALHEKTDIASLGNITGEVACAPFEKPAATAAPLRSAQSMKLVRLHPGCRRSPCDLGNTRRVDGTCNAGLPIWPHGWQGAAADKPC
jgi:hypothetical protein